MPFVQRDEHGEIIAVSEQGNSLIDEQVDDGDPALLRFLETMLPEPSQDSLSATDQSFIRVLEDVVQLMVDKGLILFTDLPQSAQDKMLLRQQLRSKIHSNLDLLGDD